MMVTKSLTTNYQTTAFIFNASFLNDMKVVGWLGSRFGSKKRSMFSVWIGALTTYYLLYKEKEKRGVKRVAAKRLVTKVVGSQHQILSTQERTIPWHLTTLKSSHASKQASMSTASNSNSSQAM